MIDIIMAIVGILVLVVCTVVAVISEYYSLKIKKKILKGVEVVENAYNDWKN